MITHFLSFCHWIATFCNTNVDSVDSKEIDDGTLNQVFTLNSRLTYYMTLIFANLTWKKYRIKRWCILQISRESQGLCEKRGSRGLPLWWGHFGIMKGLSLVVFSWWRCSEIWQIHMIAQAAAIFVFVRPPILFFSLIQLPFCVLKSLFFLLTTIFIACEARLSSTTMSSIIPQAILVKSNYFKGGGEGKGASLQFRNVHFWSLPLLANSTYLFTCDRLVPQSLFNTKVASS